MQRLWLLALFCRIVKRTKRQSYKLHFLSMELRKESDLKELSNWAHYDYKIWTRFWKIEFLIETRAVSFLRTWILLSVLNDNSHATHFLPLFHLHLPKKNTCKYTIYMTSLSKNLAFARWNMTALTKFIIICNQIDIWNIVQF